MKNCTYLFRTVLCICILAAGTLPGFSQQIEKGIRLSTGEYLGFLEYKPADYSTKTSTTYPLIIFLHGIGERGNGTTDLKNVACCGIPRIISRGNKMTFTWNGKTETFIVLSPQCPRSYGMWPSLFVRELIQYAKNNLRVDENRIFLTGLSMGGGGTFKFISTNPEHPKTIAAAATICAPCTFQDGKMVADAKLPFWGFHAADDKIAPASCTETAVRRINENNPVVKPLKTIWPTGGHIVWDRVYTDTNYRYNGVVNIYEWFLGQNKTWLPNKLPVANAGGTINISASPGVATLNASGSSDPDGKIVRYVWKKLEGPTAGIITNAFSTSSSTTVTGLTIPGTYKYELSVVDNRASYTSDIVTVVVSSGAASDNKLPIAKAGSDVVITLPTNSTKLDATGSSDPDGSIVSYSWSKVSGPAASILSPSNSVITLSMLSEGTYVFKLRVTDNKGATAEDQVTVTVKAALPNVAPIARAGVNFSITLPQNQTSLNGSTSEDTDGTIKAFAWSKVSGPAGGILSSPSSATTTVSSLQEGIYIFKLKVTDNAGATGEDQITVTVNAAPNVAPVARAGADIAITLPVNKSNLVGTGSSDSDGTIASYVWSKISGPVTFNIVSATSATTEVNGLVEGIYQFKLKVTDNRGATAEDLVNIKVNPALNINPVADAGEDITIRLPENRTILDGSGSADSDGSISDYAWTKIAGPGTFIIEDGSLATTNFSNLVQGTYSIRLQVTDNKGAKTADTIKVNVLPALAQPNVAPVAQAGENKVITLPVSSVRLDGSLSSDEDGSIEGYQWSYLDGPLSYTILDAMSAATDISNLEEGTYYFRLEVTDNDGAKNADTVSVQVKKQDVPPPPPNKIPVAKAGEDKTIVLPISEVTLDGSTSVDDDGTLLNYSWAKIAGPTQFKIASPSYHITKVTNLIQGTYTFRLQVKDNDGALAYDTINVVVLPAPNKVPVAKAGIDMQIQLPLSEVQLDGTDSYDPDGTLIGYSWEYVSGPSGASIAAATGSATKVTGLTEGVYTFRLSVSDDESVWASDIVKVTVLPEPPNVAPTALAGTDLTAQLPDPSIQLNGSESYDTDGQIVSYSWVKTSGPGGVTIVNSTTSTATIVGLVEGVYSFRLTVTDDDGKAASDVVNVTITAAPPVPNEKPIAAAGENQEISSPATSATLDGSHSADMDGNIVSYEWKLLSGPAAAFIQNSNAAITAITGLQAGEYMVELIVRDDNAAEDRDTVHISVISILRYEEVMTIYPNPAVSSLNVQLTSDTMGVATISIYNSMGSVIKSVKKDKTQAQLFENVNVSNLQTGLYYVEIMIGGKLRRISKFVKRQ
jgi:predicted esterase